MRPLTFSLLLLLVSQVPAQDKYAVVIGVNTYDASIFSNLKYAAEDANDLAEQHTEIGFFRQ